MGKPAAPAGKGKPEAAVVVEKCIAHGCKDKEARFSFCTEHFDQYKFGLINKKGEPVSDYEKKLEHYQAYKLRVAAHKVA